MRKVDYEEEEISKILKRLHCFLRAPNRSKSKKVLIGQNGSEWLQMVPYGSIWFHMVPYGSKEFQRFPKGSKGFQGEGGGIRCPNPWLGTKSIPPWR